MPIRFRLARSTFTTSAALIFVALLADARPAAAQELTISAAMEMSQLYRPDSWQPVRIELRNPTDRVVEGTAVLPLSHPQAPVAMQLPLTVPPRASVTAIVWAYFPPPSAPPGAEKGTGGAPLAVAEFRGPGGSLLARSDLLGVPITFRGGDGSYNERGEVVLLVNERGEAGGEPYDLSALVDHIADVTAVSMSVASITRDVLPRQAAGLRAVKAVILDAVDPDTFDAAQRAALETYLNSGGIVVVSAPLAAVGRSGSWFERHFPVQLIGSREGATIDTSADGGSPLKLRTVLPIIEAVERPAGEGGADMLLRGKDYVHVATKSVGLGKVVFTSFPLNGLDEKQPQVAMLWEQLLGVRRPLADWRDTQLGEARHQVLGSMIGRKVAPWPVAAGVAGGYVLLILAAQALFLGPARPKAFVASVTAAVVVSGALLAMGIVRRGDSGLQAARLAVIDVAAEGNGWQQESLAFVGKDDAKMGLRPANERVMIRPALADDSNPPAVKQQPFAVEETGVAAERIERVWEASGPADPKLRIDATAQLNGNGLTLDVDNNLGAALESPLVVWNGRVMTTSSFPVGRSTSGDFQLNARQVFTERGFVTSDEAKRRARLVAASFAPAAAGGRAADAPPILIGWITSPAEPLAWPVDRDHIETKSMVMVRTPLRFTVAPPGTKVMAPPALVRVDTGRLPYDHAKGESVATPQPGSWQIALEPPTQMGRVRPSRVRITARVTLPAHAMRLSLGTRPALGPDAGGVEWANTVGPVELTFECGPSDFDANGRIPMTLAVEPRGGDGSTAWQVSDLSASVEGDVAGAPAPIVLEPPQDAKPPADELWVDEPTPMPQPPTSSPSTQPQSQHEGTR